MAVYYHYDLEAHAFSLVTTSMSALFDRGPGVVSRPITFNRSIEIRDIPFVFPTQQALYPDTSNDYTAVVLQGLFSNMSTHWMYTATIQLALNGSQPAWSQDGWSFVPVGMDNLNSLDLPHDLVDSDLSVGGAPSNVSFTTPAIRGRIECSEYPLHALTNISNWLTPQDLSNHTTWNTSTIPRDDQESYLQSGYRLGTTGVYANQPSVITPFDQYDYTVEASCPGCTTVFVNPSSIVCCANGTSSDWDGSVAVGYWSPQTNPATWTTRNWGQNFTAKWIYGNAVTGIKNNIYRATQNELDIDMLFPTPPSLSMLNCKPVVESADADITVNPANGKIQSFNITSKPKVLTDAFSDNFLPHNKTQFSRETYMVNYNVTVR